MRCINAFAPDLREIFQNARGDDGALKGNWLKKNISSRSIRLFFGDFLIKRQKLFAFVFKSSAADVTYL